MKIKMQTWLSYLVILLPLGYGLWNYGALPATLTTHFSGLNGRPDGFMPKPWLVFGMPVLMLVLQLFCLGVTRINARHKGAAPRFERIMTWIIPLITVVVYVTTIAYNLGHQVDVRRIAVALIAVVFVAMGNYLPTISAAQYSQMHRGVHPQAAVWQRIKYWYGYTMVGGGVLLLISLVGRPVLSIVVLIITIVILLGFTGYAWRRRAG